MGLLDGGIASMVKSGIGWLMLDGSIRKWSAGTFNQATQKLTGRTGTLYAVKGFIDEDISKYIKEGSVIEAEAFGLILQVGAAAAPSVGDHLILKGTWKITNVQEDPADATWICALVGAGDEQ